MHTRTTENSDSFGNNEEYSPHRLPEEEKRVKLLLEIMGIVKNCNPYTKDTNCAALLSDFCVMFQFMKKMGL